MSKVLNRSNNSLSSTFSVDKPPHILCNRRNREKCGTVRMLLRAGRWRTNAAAVHGTRSLKTFQMHYRYLYCRNQYDRRKTMLPLDGTAQCLSLECSFQPSSDQLCLPMMYIGRYGSPRYVSKSRREQSSS